MNMLSDWKQELKNIFVEAKSLKIGYAKEWLKKLRTYKKICIFGAGEHGITWYNVLEKTGIKAEVFCDNDEEKWGKEIINGVKCISPKEYRKEAARTACIIAMRKYEDVYEQLSGWGMKENLFVGTVNTISFLTNYECIGNLDKLAGVFSGMWSVMELCEDEMSKKICCQTLRKWFLDIEADIPDNGEAYFFNEEIRLSEKECLVDAGAFDGDTIRSFLEAIKGAFSKIYAFEMDERNYEQLKRNCLAENKDSRIELYQIGLSDKKGVLHYSSNFQTSQLEEKGKYTCEINCLDDILEGKPVTFIKMDIEGSEMEALRGAKRIIMEKVPKLAICIYHSMKDFLEIPLFIKELNPKYKIMIRHHSDTEAETVCYAYEE